MLRERIGSTFAGREVVELIGIGGMAEVYLVRNPNLSRFEALKVAPAIVGSISTRRFAAEASVMAKLEHPNIATIYEAGVSDGVSWFLMQYLPGADLTGRRLSVRELLVVANDVGSALDYAHSRGVVHRDVKPSNIQVRCRADGTVEKATVLDFGVAKLRSATALTEVNSFVGTLGYSAPEAISGDSSTPEVDQYSFACTMFELVTGELPYPQSTVTALIAAHASAPVPRISTLVPRYRDTDAVFAKALAKDPHDRYVSCGAFADALVAALQVAPNRRSGEHSRVGSGSGGHDRGRDARGSGDYVPVPRGLAQGRGPAGADRAPAGRQDRLSGIYLRRRMMAGVVAVLVTVIAVLSGYLLLRNPPSGSAVNAVGTVSSVAAGLSQQRAGSVPDEGSAQDGGTVWGLAVDPQGRTYAFRSFRTVESLRAAAQSQWGFDVGSWTLATFESGCAAIASGATPSPRGYVYESATGFDRGSAQQAAVTRSEQRSGQRSHTVDTLCVGDNVG